MLPDEVGLARSLVLLGEWLLGPGAQPAPHPLASGMGSSRSLLGRRVEQLLAGPQAGAARWLRWVTAGSAAALLAVALAAPRAIAESPNP